MMSLVVNRGFRREQGVSQAAENIIPVKGTGFSPYINPAKSTRALAPEGCFSGFFPYISPFSAACLGPGLAVLPELGGNATAVPGTTFSMSILSKKTAKIAFTPTPYCHKATFSSHNSI
jgi:hypothetical protein